MCRDGSKDRRCLTGVRRLWGNKRDICQGRRVWRILDEVQHAGDGLFISSTTRTTSEVDSRIVATGAAVRIDGESEVSVERVQEAGTSL